MAVFLLSLPTGNNDDDDDDSSGCDPVVRAAYLVAYDSGRDAQLLYAVLKDQASKQLSGDGREEHVAQEELIDMVGWAGTGVALLFSTVNPGGISLVDDVVDNTCSSFRRRNTSTQL